MADKIDTKKLIPAGEAFDIISFGVKAVQETSQGLKKSMQLRIQQQKNIQKDQKIDAARLLNKKKNTEKEKALEATPKDSGAGGMAKSVKRSAGGIFNRIMTAISSVVIGWLIDKLPQIFAWVTNAVKAIKPLIKAVRTVFESLFKAMSGIFEAAEGFLGGDELDKIPKDTDKVGKEFEALDDDLKKQRDTLDENFAGVKDSINKFAKDNAKKNVADPEKSPIGQADEHLHANQKDGIPDGLDTSQHDKAMHPPGYVAPEEADKEARANKLKEDGAAQSHAKDATTKPRLDYNNQSKTVAADLAKIKPEQWNPKAATISKTKTKSDTKMIPDPPPAVVQTDTSSSSEAVGDGVASAKVVTPQGLGMDMYSRKIILNPDAARGWKKLLTEAAKDGIDLTKAVTSSYRSPEKQKELISKEDGVNVITPAPVHLSPHVQGWAVDLATNTPEWKWLKANGPKFGWRWQGEADPVHFDYMKGAQDNTHWMQPGRNDWMQGNLKTGEKVSSITTTTKKTVIPIPINSIAKQMSPPPSNDSVGRPKFETVGSTMNLMKAIKTINSAYT